MDEQNNDVNRLNTVLGVQEDKSVGSKIDSFIKKFKGIPENREVRLTAHANFNKADRDFKRQLKTWEKYSKRQQGSPMLNYLFGDRNRVKQTKRIFDDLAATAKKSFAKNNSRLDVLQGADRLEREQTGQSYGGLWGKVVGDISNVGAEIVRTERKLKRLEKMHDILLDRQKRFNALPDEQKMMKQVNTAKKELSSLQATYDKLANNTLDGAIGSDNILNAKNDVLKWSRELNQLAGMYYNRTKKESLFDQIRKDIEDAEHVSKTRLTKLIKDYNTARGIKGGYSNKLKSLENKNKEEPNETTQKQIMETQAKLMEAENEMARIKDELAKAQVLSDIVKGRRADFDDAYSKKEEIAPFTKDKNYTTVELPAKFDDTRRDLFKESKGATDMLKGLTTPKQLADINKKLEEARLNVIDLDEKFNKLQIDKSKLEPASAKLEETDAKIKKSNESMKALQKESERLGKVLDNVKAETEDIQEQMALWAADLQANPFSSNLEARDLQGISNQIDDLNVRTKRWWQVLKKSNVITRIIHRTFTNIRSQISDMFNPLTKFREGWDSWLDRWDNLPWKNTFDVIGYNMVTAFEPVFKWLAQALIKVAQIANVFIQRWTGVNLFDKSAWQLEQIKKGMGQLTASFDELHSNNDNPNQFNTIFDTDPSQITPLDNETVDKLKSAADTIKKIWDNVIGFVTEHPIASAIIGGMAALFGPSGLLLLGKWGIKAGWNVLKGIGKIFTKIAPNTTEAIKGFGTKIGDLLGKELYTVTTKTGAKAGITLGKALLGGAMVIGGTAGSIGIAANAGKNWEDLSTGMKAVSVAGSGLMAGMAGLGAVMLGASGPVGWAVAGGVALTSLVVGMSQTQNGIKSLKKETKEWQETQKNLADAVNLTRQATDNYDVSLVTLKQLEEQTGYSGEQLAKAVKNGMMSTKDMNSAQLQVYNAYKQVQQALEDLNETRKVENKLVRQEAKDSTDVLFRKAKESKSYDELADHINTCWKNGTMTTEQARDEISRCMADMSASARTELLEKLQPALQEGLDYEKYQSGWHEFGRFWEELWTNAVGVHDASMANMKATEEDLLATTDALKKAQEDLAKARDNLTIAEKNAGMTWEELKTKLDNGEISISKMTDAQRKLYEAHLNVENSSTLVDQAMQKTGETITGLAKQTYQASGDWKKYIDTLVRANKNGELSTEDMEREIGIALGEMSGSTEKEARRYLNSIGQMTNGVEKACHEQEGFFRNMFKNIGNWISNTVNSWGDWWANLLPGGETSFSRQYNREVEAIQNNPYYDEETKKRLIGQIPQYAVGTNYVPHDQLAYVHQGEAIIPAKYNKPYQPNSNSNLDSTLSAMTQEIANLRTLVQQGIPVKGEFRQRGSDLVAVVEKGKNKNGNQPLSNPAYAR